MESILIESWIDYDNNYGMPCRKKFKPLITSFEYKLEDKTYIIQIEEGVNRYEYEMDGKNIKITDVLREKDKFISYMIITTMCTIFFTSIPIFVAYLLFIVHD